MQCRLGMAMGVWRGNDDRLGLGLGGGSQIVVALVTCEVLPPHSFTQSCVWTNF